MERFIKIYSFLGNNNDRKNNSKTNSYLRVQLAYVLPRPSLKLLPSEFHEILLSEEKGELSN